MKRHNYFAKNKTKKNNNNNNKKTNKQRYLMAANGCRTRLGPEGLTPG